MKCLLPVLLILFYVLGAYPRDESERGFVRLHPVFDQIVPANAKLEKISDGHTWIEGPAWNAKGRYLLFSDIPANAIFMWKEGKGTSLFMKPSGYSGKAPFAGREPGSNGLTFDQDGRLIICEHGDRRVTRIEADGRRKVLADSFNGRRLNSPNDAVVAPNGDIYFTDPPFGLPATFSDSGRELDFCGVYRLSVDGELTLLTKEIGAPNGIAFSPDGKRLYITDVDARRPAWLVYDVDNGGLITNGRLFHDAAQFIGQYPGAPDGLKVDRQGYVFGSGPGGVYVFSPEGTHLGTIITGVATSNCAWGDDGSTLYITAGRTLYRIRLNTKGPGFP